MSLSSLRVAIALAAAAVAISKLYEHIKDKQLTVLRPRTRGVESLIGNTPMVEIKSLSRLTGCKIWAKLELANPGGSAKDRVALAILREAEKDGYLRPNCNDVIVEGTSGSTGISLAMLANALGYTAHICLPNDTSPEKLQVLHALGATIEPVNPALIVDPSQYTNAARARAATINKDTNDNRQAIFADQFENDVNWRIHYNTTGPEISRQMSGCEIDAFVTGSGTGGTIAGVSKFLKKQNANLHVVLADPQGSGLANRINFGVMYDLVEKEGTRRRHQVDTLVEGIGLNRLTHNFRQAEPHIDEAIRVTDKQALQMAKFLSVNDGLFWGASAAINCVAVATLAYKLGPGHNIVTIACDSGERHTSKFWKAAADIPNNIRLDEILEH